MSVLYTTVPYTWRRHLFVARVVLASCGFLLYIAEPVSYSLLAVPLFGAFALLSLYTWLRAEGDWAVRSFWLLGADTLFLAICALHPHPFGRWLTTMAYFHVLLLGTLLHSWKYVAALAALSVAILCSSRPASECAETIVSAVLAVLFALYKDQLQDRLSSALRRSVLSRSEAELAREQERQRIAGDFHDGPLQTFISFQMRLEIIRKLLGRDVHAALAELVQLQNLGRNQVTELRAFLRGMQPVEITAQTLGAAIRESVEHFERDSGISAHLFCPDLSKVGDTAAAELLQILREALNNVRKHSKASRVSISIEAVNGHIELNVEDDGSGFPFSGTYSLDELEVLRLGPRSIKRRVRTLAGDLTLDSKPSVGSTIRMRIPISQ